MHDAQRDDERPRPRHRDIDDRQHGAVGYRMTEHGGGRQRAVGAGVEAHHLVGQLGVQHELPRPPNEPGVEVHLSLDEGVMRQRLHEHQLGWGAPPVQRVDLLAKDREHVGGAAPRTDLPQRPLEVQADQIGVVQPHHARDAAREVERADVIAAVADGVEDGVVVARIEVRAECVDRIARHVDRQLVTRAGRCLDEEVHVELRQVEGPEHPFVVERHPALDGRQRTYDRHARPWRRAPARTGVRRQRAVRRDRAVGDRVPGVGRAGPGTRDEQIGPQRRVGERRAHALGHGTDVVGRKGRGRQLEELG